ncbi:DUF2207 domain-containing protein [Deltaproteobacteria bacterium PRO3]|nr:DUF2207 domain-containing protein [Deltaproteobacteria bacterium PRO3]
MKKFVFFISFVFVTILFHSTLSATLKAVTFEYPEYNVDISINTDSSFTVTEKAVYRVYGDFHGLRRDLTLADARRDELCRATSNLYCGGFDRVVVNSVKDLSGNDITNLIKLYAIEDEDNDKRSMRFEWEIFPNGENQNGTQFGWILNYTIYGGIAAVENSPYFYWNLLPENRSGIVDSSVISIKLPQSAALDITKLKVYTDMLFRQSSTENSITFQLNNLPSYGPFTAAYQFENSEIQLPGQITYTISPAFSYSVYLDGINVTDQVDGVIKSVTAGQHLVRFEHIGYEAVEQLVDVESGKTRILDINLKPHPWMHILLIINNLICICGCLLIPFGLLAVYMHYRKRGRDKDMPKTIIPLFKPPANTRPYLVGSLADEQVDRHDVVGTIIDLAYRGYLKIKEIDKNKNYELTKLEGKSNDPGLNEIETQIFNALFKKGDIVQTKDLGSSFPYDYVKIQQNIYKEMVNEGYFNRAPKTTIGLYAGFGVFAVVFGFLATICVTTILITFLGVITLFTPGILIVFVGIAILIIAKFMPAKTAKGSKVYADILGFKMYMQTAERFTVQKLEPEHFVKYLSYAIVFKIEKEWAKKFEDIYKGQPEWFEGTNDIYNALWVSSFARSFSNSTTQSMMPITSGSSSGSGWSGGGSFGGFSGGGGGGGSSGGEE